MIMSDTADDETKNEMMFDNNKEPFKYIKIIVQKL